MAPPLLKRFPPPGQELVPLIDRRNAGNRPALMIQNLIGNMGRSAKSRHSGDARAAEIMQTPAGHSRKLIQLPLGTAERQKRLLASG
jgi:hypothetical protein